MKKVFKGAVTALAIVGSPLAQADDNSSNDAIHNGELRCTMFFQEKGKPAELGNSFPESEKIKMQVDADILNIRYPEIKHWVFCG